MLFAPITITTAKITINYKHIIYQEWVEDRNKYTNRRIVLMPYRIVLSQIKN